jgi:hypothetical protein
MRGRAQHDQADSGIGKTAIFAALIAGLLAGGVAMVATATTLDLGPKVGDILVFRQGARVPTDWEFAVSNSAPNATMCSLRPDAMAAHGGSLVVEERFTKPRSFLVHWAGGSTSTGRSDCGSSADLVVSRADLQLLSNAVGGPGVERSTFTRFEF